MIRKLGLTTLLATALFSTNTFSATEHTFSLANAYEFTLPANEPQLFSNIFFWTIEANCTISTADKSDILSLTVIKKSGSLNNILLTQGDSISILVHQGDVMRLTAESGGRIELTNRGKSTVKASCTAGK